MNAVLVFARSQRTAFLSLFGLAWGALLLVFWVALELANAGLMLAALAVGGLIGALSGKRMSGEVIEPGLVPLGALGIFAVLLHAWLTQGHWLASEALVIGAFAALCLRPQLQLLAQRTPPELRRAVATAAAALLLVAMMLGGLFAHWLAAQGLGIGSRILALLLMHAAVTLFVMALAPEFLMRLLAWLLVHLLYRLDARGLENIPRQGPVLLTCNHVSFMDALIIGGVMRRPTRFVMYYKIFQVPVLSFIFRSAGAIPIAGAREDPVVLEQALASIRSELDAGHVLCVFPEGKLTPDGSIQPFKPGIERILADRPVPVVPMALRGLWSGMWSKRDSQLGRSRLPRRLRATVELLIEPALPGVEVSAAGLEERIRRLRGERA